MRKLFSTTILAAGFALALTFTFSCSDDKDEDGGGIAYGSLPYEGQTYKTVKIGDQTWMAENLNYNVSGSQSQSVDGADYRQYDWAMAMALPSSCNSTRCSTQIQPKHKGICPSGWHIPTVAEWTTLINFVESDKGCTPKCAGTYLLATDYSGSDSYGFSAQRGYLWTASEAGYTLANDLYIKDDNRIYQENGGLKEDFYAVRCVQD